MAVSSPPTRLGSALPDITLPDLDGVPVRLADHVGTDALLVVFSCNHCPYVRLVEDRLGILADAFEGAGLRTVAICPNDVAAYPDDDVPGLRDQQRRASWHFPYLVDAEQTAARAFGAVCTPDLFLYAPDGTLAYRGAFDESRPGNGVPVTGHLLRDAVTSVLAGRPAPQPQRHSLGCGIKWKPGNEPT
jgi:peroxiredoxin